MPRGKFDMTCDLGQTFKDFKANPLLAFGGHGCGKLFFQMTWMHNY